MTRAGRTAQLVIEGTAVGEARFSLESAVFEVAAGPKGRGPFL